jgi:hypothetical protein
MRRALAVVVTFLLAASAASAESPKLRADDAPQLLKDALRTGKADRAAFAAISEWILYEQEEAVAAGIADALASVAPEIVADGVDARWAPTAQAVLNVFARVLADAQHNRHGDRVLDEEVAELIAIGAPLVSAALRESPAADRAKLLAVFGALGPVADDLVPLLSKGLRHEQRDVRIGASRPPPSRRSRRSPPSSQTVRRPLDPLRGSGVKARDQVFDF